MKRYKKMKKRNKRVKNMNNSDTVCQLFVRITWTTNYRKIRIQ